MPAETQGPIASVVIPTYNREESVAECVEALFTQDLPADRFEIIVVDDGSTDGTADRIREVAESGGRQVAVIRQERSGPSAARNAGAAAARGEVLAFIDSDTLPHRAWLLDGLGPFYDPGVAGVEGKTIIPEGRGGGPFARRTRNPFGKRYLGCNLFFRKEAFDEVGGFDERFGLIPFREDTDLAHRIMERGGRIPFVPTAVVSHPVKAGTWRTPLAQAWRYRNDPLLCRKSWRLYMSRVDVHSLGLLSIWKPRQVVYLAYLVALPGLVLAPWAAGAAALALVGILFLHLHKFAPRDASPQEIILLFPVCAAVPFVFLAALLAGMPRALKKR